VQTREGFLDRRRVGAPKSHKLGRPKKKKKKKPQWWGKILKKKKGGEFCTEKPGAGGGGPPRKIQCTKWSQGGGGWAVYNLRNSGGGDSGLTTGARTGRLRGPTEKGQQRIPAKERGWGKEVL